MEKSWPSFVTRHRRVRARPLQVGSVPASAVAVQVRALLLDLLALLLDRALGGRADPLASSAMRAAYG